MRTKEKAKELFNKYYQKCADSSYPEYMAKDCALIAVDEIIKEVNQNFTSDRYAYWQEVKEEIEKL
jgi:hypothetical protein